MKRWMAVAGIILVVWLGFRLFGSAARLAFEECVAALEAAYPVADALPENPDLRAAELDAFRAELQRRLRESDDIEARFVDVMYDSSRRGRIGRVTSILRPETDNPLLAWHSLRMCADLPVTACPNEQLEDRLLALDAGNSEVWALIAASRDRRDDDGGALEALVWAGRSPRSNAYWTETVELFDRVIAEHSDPGVGRRISEVLGSTVSLPLPYFDTLMQSCRQRAATNVDRAAACLAYGRALERQGMTVRARDFGLELQLAVAGETGDRDSVSAITMRNTLLDSEYQAAAERFSRVTEVILRSGPGVLARYLATVRRDNAAVAMRGFVEQEIDAVLEPVGLADCGPTILDE